MLGKLSISVIAPPGSGLESALQDAHHRRLEGSTPNAPRVSQIVREGRLDGSRLLKLRNTLLSCPLGALFSVESRFKPRQGKAEQNIESHIWMDWKVP